MEQIVKMGDGVGLHGRPGVLLVDLCRNFPESHIVICKDGKEAQAKSLLNLLALGVVRGDNVTVRIEGGDEESAFARAKAILSGEVR